MARIHSILGGLLVVQLGLAALTWWPSSDAQVEPKKLVTGGGNTITKLSVVGPGKESKTVELVQRDGHWLIASESEYPADDAKVAEMVDALAKIELGAPIASNATSFAKLKVADDDFGKRVTFTADGAEHTLLVGAAKSKAVYLRVDGGNDVWLVKGPSEFVFKDSPRSLWKTNYVEFDKSKVSAFAITKDGVTQSFRKDGEVWSLENPPDGFEAKASKVEELVGKVAALRLNEPAGKNRLPEMGLDAGIQISWSTTDGTQTTSGALTLGAEADGKVYAQAQGNPFIVFVPKYGVKDLQELTPDALIQPIAAAPAAPPAGELPLELMTP